MRLSGGYVEAVQGAGAQGGSSGGQLTQGGKTVEIDGVLDGASGDFELAAAVVHVVDRLVVQR